MTTAFNSVSHGKIKLNRNDYYQGDENNSPSLEVEYTSDGETKTAITDSTRGDISRAFNIFTINNPVYAKPTGRTMGGHTTHTAELYIADMEVCTIPDKVVVDYKFNDIKRKFGRSTPNLSSFFSSETGLDMLICYKQELKKCVSQVGIQNLLSDVTSENALDSIETLYNKSTLSKLIDVISESNNLNKEDSVKYLIQIVEIVKQTGIETIQSALDWVRYKNRKERVDERLTEFNTTGLTLRSSKRKNKLVISFGRADRMSNGERDVLYFVASLVVFESSLGKKPGILIMDEVFDYLDGANLLAAQYYLSNMIKKVKDEDKIVFPIIMTHLDPAVFANYCFKGMVVHYLTSKSIIDLNDKVVKLLLLRGILKDTNDSDVNDLEKFLLHFNHQNWSIPESIITQLPDDFWQDSESFRLYLYSEVNKYLNDMDYNALAVIIGLRIKVEEKTVSALPADKIEEYYLKYGSVKKLTFADECGVNLPELFYLLQPLYNDSAHLRSNGRGSERENKNKIESAYLKISSKVIKTMIKEVFE